MNDITLGLVDRRVRSGQLRWITDAILRRRERHERDLLQRLLQGFSEAVAVIDAQQRVVAASAAASALLSGARTIDAAPAPGAERVVTLGARTWLLRARPCAALVEGDSLTVLEWRDLTEDLSLRATHDALLAEVSQARRRHAEIEQALDQSASHVMLVDRNLRITWMNRKIRTMLVRIGAMPNSSEVERTLGGPLSVLDSAGVLQKALKAPAATGTSGTGTVAIDIRLCGNPLRVIATPLLDAQGEHGSTVLLWVDKSLEVRVEAEISEVLTAVNRGDLTRRVPASAASGQFESLARGVNDIADRLAGLVIAVSGSAADVQRGAEEIVDGSASIATRTAQAAASLENTASTLQQITSAVRQTAQHAALANDVAAKTRSAASEGLSTVSAATASMMQIESASREVAGIVEVVNNIAFQINMLAINATIEAAHAGAQGRGFAVVADEVRALAGRATGASRDIAALVGNTIERVTEGAKLVAHSGATLERVVGSFSRVAVLMDEVARATHEQSLGIDQVNQAVIELDGLTQQNAALVEQSMRASTAMSEQAVELAGMMQRYRAVPELAIIP
jgi:methyl-accepting chemotaxis protein